MAHRAILALVTITCAASMVQAVVVDHNDVDAVGDVAAIPQATMNVIGQQKWFFSHASVGGNMTAGMTDLHSVSATRYPLVVASAGYNGTLQQANNPPSPTLAGRVYECSRGNPGWQSKITIFVNSVKTAGWHDPAVTVAMDKFCYIDQGASATSYLNAMVDLEATYGNTVFVYITMPLMTSTDSDNVLRNQYNSAVRNFCDANGKLLYDLADMEAHDPDGVASTFTSGGTVYQRLYAGYTSDGGHLNTTGRQRIAAGWYAVAALIASRNGPGDLNGDGRVNDGDFTLFQGCASGPSIDHDGTLTCQRADFDDDDDVDMSDFGVFQRCLNGRLPVNPACDD